MGVLSKNVTVKQAGALTFLRLSTQLGSPHWAALKRSWALFAVNPYWGAVGSCCSLFDFYPWGYCCLFGNLLYLLLTSSISIRWSKTLLDKYYYWLNSLKVKSLSRVQTLCDSMDYNLPGSSVHGIFQPRVLEWVAISFSRGSSRPRGRTQISHIAGKRFTIGDTREIKFSRELKWYRMPCGD